MKNRIMIIFIIILLIVLGISGYCLKNKDNSEQKQEIKLIVKTPVLQMTSYKDEDIIDTYTFLVKVADDFEKKYQDANVNIEVCQFAKSDEDDQIIGCFNTEQATDILYEEYFNMSTYVHTGNVVPLDDIISDEIRNDINNSYWDVSELNGKTYMMPYSGMQNVLCYNKDLFRLVGLDKYITDKDIVQNWTLKEWDNILETLHKKLPENIQTMLMYGKNQTGDTHIITLLRSRGSTFFDNNGRVKLTTPEGIKAIQWLMDCNEKGYFPANAENLEINDCYDLFLNGQLAIYINNAVLDASISKANFDYGHVNFPSIDGKGFNTTFLTGFEVFDNNDEQKLKVAKDFVKFIYENDEWLDYSAGAIPCSDKVAERFAEQLKSKQKYIDNNQSNWNFTGNAPSWRKVRDVFYKDIKELLYGQKTAEEIASQIEEHCNQCIEEGYENSKLHE